MGNTDIDAGTGAERIRLTRLTSKGGWAAKWGPGDLETILQSIAPAGVDERLLQGFATSDDAAVFRLRDDLAAVLTVDFFTPIVDDPYDFGRVAAANSLSDVYAMGATPLVALNLLALDSALGADVAAEILRGGADTVRAAGAFVAGGHTVDDPEPKYGLSVFGTVHPDRIVRNGGALPGDLLYLTKPLGVGIMAAAHKVGCIDDAAMRPVIESMAELNRDAAAAMLEAGVHAATDVTGFGLAGHLHEMLAASGCSARLSWAALPTFDGVCDLARAYCRPNRLFSIMDYAAPFTRIEGAAAGGGAGTAAAPAGGGRIAPVDGGLDDEEADLRMSVLCDPETSGGMLVALPPEHAAVFAETFERLAGRGPALVGVVTEGDPGVVVLGD